MGDSVAARMIRERDWSDHPLGPPSTWPDAMRVALGLVLNSPESMILAWGPDLFFFFNDGYFPLLGPRLSWAMGAPFREVWADAWEQAQPIIGEALAGRSVRYVDLPWTLGTDRGAAQTWWSFSYSRVVDAAGEVAGLFILTNETTERVLGRAGEERNRQILNSATDYAIVATDLEGRVTRWNEGAARVLGWTEEEMLGQSASRFFTPEDIAQGRPQSEMEQALHAGQGTDERWHLRKSGERFWASGEMTPLRDATNTVTGFVKVLRDRTQERLAQESLRQAEAGLRRAQEAGGVGVFWVGIEDDVLYPTSAFCRIYGLPERPSYPAGAFEPLIIAEDAPLVSNAQSRRRGEARTDVEYRIRRADTGALRWIARRGEIERDAQGKPIRFVGVARDITERRQVEERQAALLSLGDRVRDLTDPDDIAFAACEVIGATLGVSLAGYGNVDERAETISVVRDWTDVGVESLAGILRFRDYGSYVDDLKRNATVIITNAREDPRTRRNAAALEAKAAASFVNMPVFERGRFVALLYVSDKRPRVWNDEEVAFIRDVAERTRVATERVRSDAARRQQAETLAALNANLEEQVKERTADRNALWQLTADLMLRCTFDGRITAVNPAWTEMLGWREDELIGTSLFDLVHPEDLDHTSQGAQEVAEGTSHARFDNRYRHKDGSYRWISWTTRPGDDLINAVGRDFTADKERQDALLKAEEQLRQSQKMEAVGQLTGGVAHDFNNLLTVIRSSTDLLKRPNLTDERRARYVTAISETVDRAAKLTGQLLAFARRQALKPEVFSACESVRALTGMVGTLTGSRIAITTGLPKDPCFVNADPSQFDTALVNMAVNARDAMNGEGRLTVRVGPVDRMPAVRAHAAVPGAFVEVSITDTGSGIPPEQLDQIFEPFFTTKAVGQGTGLGLSQVFGFAKQSGGEVVVDSEVGRGTTFTLYLPRVAEPARAPGTGEPEPLVDGHGTCVLVVEDNPDVGTFAVQTLTDLGYAIVLANNAEEALVELCRDDSRFDVVFTDVVMPGMNGIELGQAIRRQYQDLPVVLTSGYSHVLAQNGTSGFELLHKPYSIEQLSQILRKAAAWRQRKRMLQHP